METAFPSNIDNVSQEDARPTVLSVERAIVLLKKLRERRHPVGVRELARETGYSPSMTQKLLNALAKQGMVHQDPKTASYTLGLETFRIGASMLEQIDLHEMAHPVLEVLAEQTQESSYLALLTPGQTRCVFVDRVDSRHLLRWIAYLGTWRPLNCTADGKAMLAWLSDDHLEYLREREALYQLTDRSVIDIDRLQEQLGDVHDKGYAYSDEEFAEGVRSIAAPIFQFPQDLLGSVSIAGPKLRMTDDRIPALGDQVHRAGREISRALGYEGPKGGYGDHAG